MRLKYITIFFLVLLTHHCYADVVHTISSPNGQLIFRIISADKEKEGVKLFYELDYKNRPVIRTSQFWFLLKEPSARLDRFEIIGAEQSKMDRTWKPTWGETHTIRDNFNQLALSLRGEKGIML